MALSPTASDLTHTAGRFQVLSRALLTAVCLVTPAGAMAAGQLILAASWQPAFCETRPGVKECRTQTAHRFDADHFALHGLWPQPRNKAYCSVAPALIRADKKRRWLALPKLRLTPRTRSELQRVMPGVASGLHRHEWVKHGSCYSNKGAEHYYRVSLDLMHELNASRVRALFRAHLGKRLSSRAVRLAFDDSFGRGAGKRVRIQCKRVGNRKLISELQIALGKADGRASFADAILRGRKLTNRCKSGIVDVAGIAPR